MVWNNNSRQQRTLLQAFIIRSILRHCSQ